MATEEKEGEKRGIKRSLNEMVGDDIGTIAPSKKRRKISGGNNKMKGKLAAKFAHFNFDPTKMRVDAVAPKQKAKETSEKKEIEMDQSIILNKPIIANKARRKRTKKRIQINENEHKSNESLSVPQNLKDLILRKKNDICSGSEEIKTIRYLENARIKTYNSINKLFVHKKGTHILSIECFENEEILEKIIIINDSDGANELFLIEIEDKITMDSISISEGIEYTFLNGSNEEYFVGEITFSSLQYYKRSKFSVWKKQIISPVCEAAFKRLLCIGLINKMFDRFVFKSPEHEINNFIVQDNNGRNVYIPRPVEKLRKWSVKNRKYVPIDPHLDGAPKDNEKEKYWENMINQFKEKYGNQYIDDLLASFNAKK